MSSAISSTVLIRRASRNTCWPSTTVEPFRLQRRQDRHLDHVDAEWLGGQPVLAQHGCDLSSHFLGDAGVRVERASQRGDPGAGAGSSFSRSFGDLAVVGLAVIVEPRVVELVVPRGGSEVPDHRLAAARQQREPDQLVHRPGADVGGRHVADVGEVEGQQCTQLGSIQVLSEAL